MQVPETLRYSEEHEWVLIEGAVATIGITDHAQEELGDIVFVELPAVGTALTKAATLGVVESVKAETINEDPYGAGWMVKVTLTDASEVAGLMTAAQYREFVTQEKA